MLENGLNRIYLKNLLPMIDRTDIRTAGKWCIDNEVTIYPDGSRDFVIQSELNYALEKPIIIRYKKEYGENWEVMYDLAKKDKLYIGLHSTKRAKQKEYKAKSAQSQKLLEKLRNK